MYLERLEKVIFICSGVFEYDEKSFFVFYKFSCYVVMFCFKWLVKIFFMGCIFMVRFFYKFLFNSMCNIFLEDFFLVDFDVVYGIVLIFVSKKVVEWLLEEFKKLIVLVLLICGEYD